VEACVIVATGPNWGAIGRAIAHNLGHTPPRAPKKNRFTPPQQSCNSPVIAAPRKDVGQTNGCRDVGETGIFYSDDLAICFLWQRPSGYRVPSATKLTQCVTFRRCFSEGPQCRSCLTDRLGGQKLCRHCQTPSRCKKSDGKDRNRLFPPGSLEWWEIRRELNSLILPSSKAIT
jgi:hypothetical protein